MKRKLLVLSLLLVGCQTPKAHRAAGTNATEAPTPPVIAAASDAERAALLDRVKGLEGLWEGHFGEQAIPGQTQFTISSGGSAVREIMFPGAPHEMTNMYHLDGSTLVMTHYCAAGNQVTLRAKLDGSPDTLSFDFERITNLTGDGAHFMGRMKLTFLDQGRIRQDWTSFENGAVKGVASFDWVRKAD
jgi:hypothetical protein